MNLKSLIDEIISCGIKLGVCKVVPDEITTTKLGEIVKKLKEAGDDHWFKELLKLTKSRSYGKRWDAVAILSSPSLINDTPKKIFEDRLNMDTDPWIWKDACDALTHLGDKSAEAKYERKLLAAIKNPDTAGAKFCDCVGMIAKVDPKLKLVEKLCKYLLDSEITVQKKMDIAVQLAVGRHKTVIPYIKQLIKDSEKDIETMECFIRIAEGKEYA